MASLLLISCYSVFCWDCHGMFFYHQPSIIILINLVFTDIGILAHPLPLLIVTVLLGEHIVGNSDRVRCQTCSFGYSTLTPLCHSLFTVAIMSVARFLYIYKPLKYDTKVTKIWMLVPILIAWVVSLVIGLTFQASPGDVNFQPVFLSIVLNKMNYFLR